MIEYFTLCKQHLNHADLQIKLCEKADNASHRAKFVLNMRLKKNGSAVVEVD